MSKKILVVINHLSGGGGAEKIAVDIGNSLYKKGYEIKYLTFSKSDNPYNYKGENICMNDKNVNNTIQAIWYMFKRAWKIKKVCKKYNIDTVHSHMEGANFANIMSKVLFFNTSKIVTHVHSDVFFRNKDKPFTRVFINLFYNKTDKLICITKNQKENILKYFKIKKGKIKVIYNGLDIKNINVKLKEDLGEYKDLFNNGKYTFINIGRLIGLKNHKLLLNAFEEFHKSNPNTQLVILGDGELKEKLQNHKESLNSGSDIHFLGNQSNPYKFLANSDAFVFSSSREGFGIVLVEAMACGLPVISTDCQVGPKEILNEAPHSFDMVEGVSYEDNGILVPIENADALKDAMEKLYNNKELQSKLIENSKQRAQKFDINSLLTEWEGVL